MDTRITLRAARYNAGYKLTEAALSLGINKDTLTKIERDSSDIPRSIMFSIEELYQYPVDNIFFGIESDFFRTKRNDVQEGLQ